MNKNLESKVAELILADSQRCAILRAVNSLMLSEGYVAAGFVRNLVWDYLHSYPVQTPFNDVDVIYFDVDETDNGTCHQYEKKLTNLMPDINWQVRNQAKMHLRNGDAPYLNVIDAMSFWPEKETAVAVRMKNNGEIQCISAFGYNSLFGLKISHNPKRDKDIFLTRIVSKNWLTIWPKLALHT